MKENLDSKRAYSLPFAKILLYSLLPAFVLFGLVEGCARLFEVWRPPLTLDYGWGFNEDSRVFEPTGIFRERMSTRLEKIVSFNDQRFAMPKPQDTYRIIIIGGSNVNYMQYTLEDMVRRLNRIPGDPRRFEVINCGGLAYGSYRLRIMMSELLTYQPDLLLVYSGHNEFEELVHQKMVDVESIPIQRVAYSLATLRLLRDIQASLQLSCVDVERLRETLPPEVNFGESSDYQFSAQEIKERMRLYRENLTDIITRCRASGVPVIISTVVSNYWAPDIHYSHANEKAEVQRLYEAGKYAEGMELARNTLGRSKRHQASDVENGIIRQLAEQFDLPLIEAEQLIMEAEPNGVPGEKYLSDRCHLTSEGRDIVVKAFEKEIKRLVSPQISSRVMEPQGFRH